MNTYDNGAKYVALVKEDCKKRNLLSKDRLAPDDETKIRYWVPLGNAMQSKKKRQTKTLNKKH